MSEEIWMWNLLYNTSYHTIAATLFWQNRFLTYHEKKVKRIRQEENR
ncbi:MAG TPA: hypothetical protein VJZ68_06505 [Nitrososphaera sp.]|nr:hypothetical protein [Nitrososphaera sp.]